MKTIEEIKLLRVLRAIVKIPLPLSGFGKTTSIEGLVSYQKDMREAVVYLNNVIYAIQYKEDIDEKDVLALEEIAKRI